MAKMRINAKNNHPIYQKTDRLIRFLRDELKVELSFYSDRIFIKDIEMPTDKDWEIVDLAGEFISELPTDRYKLSREQEYDITPKRALSMEPKQMQYEVVENN